MRTLAAPPSSGRTWSDLDDFQAFIDAGGMVEPDDEMPDEYRNEVFRFIEFHANSELMGGLTERDWIPHAPGLRLKQVFLAKTQDEIGHAHLLYMVAADMGIKSRTEMLEELFDGRSRFHNVFHYQAVTWADQVAIAFLVDAAAFASQRAVFAECTYGPYKRVLKRIVAEEGFHMRHGEEMLLRIATGTPTQHEMFQAALDRWWWPAVQLFGPDSPPGDADPLLRWKIKSERNEVLRHAYVPTGSGRRARSTGNRSRRPCATADPTRRAASAPRPTTGPTPPGFARHWDEQLHSCRHRRGRRDAE